MSSSRMTPLQELRHSAAHIMATAVLRLFPQAKLDIGPPTDQGFYYDFDLEHHLTQDDLKNIEEEMARVIEEDQPFVRKEVSRAEARSFFEKRGQPYKVSRLADIPESEVITFYQNGEFIDLCAGTHVQSTGQVRAFKLLNVAGAYYRGDEKNKQLQRIYGTAFPTAKELEEHLRNLELAKEHDHRKLGQTLGLFVFDSEEIGPGLPLWLPKGAAIIEELEKLAKETEFAAGYQRVRTPHIARENLYLTSGHLPFYKDSMFAPMEFEEEEGGVKMRYYLKAMNCPHHHKLFGAQPRSYRDLPLRFAEYGTCYRYEKSGELFGLMRVRSLQMNDAHIYCTEDQFADEFRAVNEMYLRYFELFGLTRYRMRLSTHDPSKLGEKYVNEPALWAKTESMVREALLDSKIDFIEMPNEAAFYGPKIDVQVWSVIGREFTLATNQVDFAQPRRFNLEYTQSDNTKETPLCIHRAPLGTHERTIGFLIEHFGGAFPTWLSPEQARILPISDGQMDYAKKIEAACRAANLRVTVDHHSDPIGAKVRRAQLDKVPYMLVVGGREAAAGNVSVRSRWKQEAHVESFDTFLARILDEVKHRLLKPELPK